MCSMSDSLLEKDFEKIVPVAASAKSHNLASRCFIWQLHINRFCLKLCGVYVSNCVLRKLFTCKNSIEAIDRS